MSWNRNKYMKSCIYSSPFQEYHSANAQTSKTAPDHLARGGQRGRQKMSSVLIVENNDFFRRSFKEILKMYIPSLSVDESVDGSDALAKIDQTSPDIVFMDIRLPGKNGLELTREIKCHHPNLVISIFTTYDLPEYRKTAEKYGADHFLLKDALTGAEIAAMVKAVIEKKKGSAQDPHQKRTRFAREASIH
jgi:DNA-binding NarL/FixJ family response regulator